MLSAIDYCQSHAGSLEIPALLLVAGDDRLVNAEGSKRFFARLPAGLGQMHVYEGMYHEVFNELDAQRPFADLRAWLERDSTRQTRV
jgi:alpha-beta hydrolase superfamily lysophospholipase